MSPVSHFVEKPTQERAEELVREGALWNSFIFAMRAAELFALFQWALPWLTRMFDYALVDSAAGPLAARVSRLYERLPNVDFSRAVLQEAGADMRVVAVPPCGWTDVGTPEGIVRCAEGCSRHAIAEEPPSTASAAALDLAEALRAYEERFGPDASSGLGGDLWAITSPFPSGNSGRELARAVHGVSSRGHRGADASSGGRPIAASDQVS